MFVVPVSQAAGAPSGLAGGCGDARTGKPEEFRQSLLGLIFRAGALGLGWK